MPHVLTPAVLHAAVLGARVLAEQRPARASSLASILRWTGDVPGSVAAATTAAEHAERVAARSGSWTKLTQAGAAWRLAGEADRAAACEARARDAVTRDPLADPGVAAALAYLAGDDSAAATPPAPPTRPTTWTRIVAGVATARTGGGLDGLLTARAEVVALVREGRHTPAAGGLPPLDLWAWLEETFVVEAGRSSAPVPGPAEMLAAAGLTPTD